MIELGIREIQGKSLFSAYAGKKLRTQGVITAILRKGFYIQTPDVVWDKQRSDAIFIFGDYRGLKAGNLVDVIGECVDYQPLETDRPITQIKLQHCHVLENTGPLIKAVAFDGAILPGNNNNHEIAQRLNSLEGMLVCIPKNAIFIAPSNPFGDYVCALEHELASSDVLLSRHGGIVAKQHQLDRWFTGFRLRDYSLAPKVNVGSQLLSDVIGPLHYRSGSWQVAASQAFAVNCKTITPTSSSLKPSEGSMTVLTLNGFNLDRKVEDRHRVKHKLKDVDDDLGQGRFYALARDIVEHANVPDIICLQEIQDNDGAELGSTVAANKTYTALIDLIYQLCGVTYEWIDVPPKPGEDGGQPGGNIRNAFLYNPSRVVLQQNSISRIGENLACFEDSRKPLLASFTEKYSKKSLMVINVHLASKRQQQSLFSPLKPGFDAKESVRVAQTEAVASVVAALGEAGHDYYITGDFNDHQHSQSLQAIVGKQNSNLVFQLAAHERYDYNHRGKLQVLMHGIVPKVMEDQGRVRYEIIHGNELTGVQPGTQNTKPSDHAYVICKIQLI